MLFVGVEDKTDERGRGRKGGKNVVRRREDEDDLDERRVYWWLRARVVGFVFFE